MNELMNYFPEGIATGDAFVNRQVERQYLINRIKSNKHTVLIAPRRYGKTSLVTKVTAELKTPYCAIDLLAAYSEEYVRDQIVDKVSRLVFELLPRVKQAKEKVIQIFKKMKPEISLSAFGQKLVLNLTNQPLQDITDVLLKLDETAGHFNKRAVIFLDEFQQISQLKNHHSIEASIRHAVERSKNISYVFSGSNRHLLQQMFGDQGRPLFRLCQTLTVERIKAEEYRDYLSRCAKARWKKLLPEEVITAIFTYTELHPFYMNVLCQIIWEENTVATLEQVATLWRHYVKTQKHIISHDMRELSVNQRKIISALAIAPIKEIQANEFLSQFKISASSAQQAVEVLLHNDLVFRDEENYYRVLDPAMKYYLNCILWEE